MRRPWSVQWAVRVALGCVLGTAAHADQGHVAFLARGANYWQVWVMEPDGTGQRQVTRSPYERTRISCFPGGQHLLVNSLSGDLYKVDLSGNEQRVPNPLPGTTDAVVAPDGARIAFSLSTAGSVDDNEIWVVNVDGTGLAKLTTMDWLQHDPQWSPDGRWIYFVSGDGGQAHDIWRVSRAGRSREQMTVGSLYHFELAFAPDGRLSFSSNRTGNYEIFTQRHLDAPSQVTHDPALDGHPTWSPDGAELIFHSTRSGSLNLWRIAAAGGAPEQLTHHPHGARGPVWCHP